MNTNIYPQNTFVLFLLVLGWIGIQMIGTSLQAQDKIFFDETRMVEVKIIEVNPTEILYKKWNYMDGPLFIVEKSSIRKVIYENGTTEFFAPGKAAPGGTLPSFFNKPDIPQQNVLKTELFAWLTNHLVLSYERRVKDKMGFEVELGIIGVGATLVGAEWERDYGPFPGDPTQIRDYDFQARQRGFFIKAGPKYMFHAKNSLRGAYFKPQVVYNRVIGSGVRIYKYMDGFNNIDFDVEYKFKGVTLGLLGNVGYQFPFTEHWVLDMSLGLGFVGKVDKVDLSSTIWGQDMYYLPYQYRNESGGENLPYRYGHVVGRNVALSASLKIGRLF